MKPLFSTMPPLKKVSPNLLSGETIVLREQGGYRTHAGAGWKVVDCLLTTRRLLLCQLQKTLVEIPLDAVCDLKTEAYYYVLRRREAIGICYLRPGRSSRQIIWMIVNGAPIWKARLFQMALLKVDEPLIRTLTERLDDSGTAILWHLWEHRHARITELADVCGTQNHMEVLTHIKDAINPVAMAQIGYPLLSFERKRVDPDTGEIVLFSWWLSGTLERVPVHKERLMDIFDEGSCFQIILEVNRVEISDLTVQAEGRELTIESHHASSHWVEHFHLPEAVVFDNHRLSLKHSLLEIRLQKAHLDGPCSDPSRDG